MKKMLMKYQMMMLTEVPLRNLEDRHLVQYEIKFELFSPVYEYSII